MCSSFQVNGQTFMIPLVTPTMCSCDLVVVVELHELQINRHKIRKKADWLSALIHVKPNRAEIRAVTNTLILTFLTINP